MSRTDTVARRIENVNLEHDIVQLIVREVVRAGMESPLREPILEGVEAATRETAGGIADASGDGGKGRSTRSVRGLMVFVAFSVALYVALRQLSGGEP